MSSVREATRDAFQGGHTVTMDLSHLDQKHIDLLFSWIEIWLNRHCKSAWHITVEDLTSTVLLPKVYMKLEFQDGKEAMYFKLSPEFQQSNPPVSVPMRTWLGKINFLVS